MLDRIARFIVSNRLLIAILGFAILLLAFIGMGRLKINYNMYSYLPQNLNSVRGQKMLLEDFGVSETLYVVVSNKTISEVNEILDRIKALPDVSETFWYSDLEDVKVPIDFAAKEAKEKFISDDDTLIQVTLKPGQGRTTREQAEAVKAVVGVDARVVGDYLYTAEIERLSNSAKSSMLVIAIGAILLVLIFALTQPAYSVMFLVSAGLAILLNFGLTGFLRGEMSFMSSSMAAALQLAVTMDYAIFLLHRYEEEKRTKPILEAMTEAISKTAVSVLSSGLTTVAGFLALLFMSMKMGGDMGVVMAQGVAIGFVLTLTWLPTAILFLDKPLSRLKHRNFSPNFTPLAKKIVANKTLIVVIFLIIGAVACVGQVVQPLSYNLQEGIKLSPDVQNDLNLVTTKFVSGNQVSIILKDLPISDRLKIESRVSQISGVTNVTGPLSLGSVYIPKTYIFKKVEEKLVKQNKALLIAQIDNSNKELLHITYEDIKNVEQDYPEKMFAAGTDMIQFDFAKLAERDFFKVNIATIVGVLIIVILSLKRVGAAALLVLGIEVAIWTNVSILFFTNAPPLFFFSTVALGAIQLGATVDYSILIATRYEEEKQTKSPEQAMIISIREGGPAIVTSALTLTVATLAISITSQLTMVKDLSMLLARGAAISGLFVIVATPALILLFDKIAIRLFRRKHA